MARARLKPKPRLKVIEASWPADVVERWALVDIKPYPNNARTHSDEQIALLARLMTEHGVDQPIVVDENGVILKGHGRLKAAALAGFETFPVVVKRGLTEEQKRADRIADNQVALLAGWDMPLLKLELGGLLSAGFDMPLLGFDTAELRQFTASDDGPDPEITPEPPAVPIVRTGDLWLLGKHRLLCGDAGSMEDVGRLLDGVTPDLANCDPPYGVSIVKGGSIGGAKPFGKGSIGGWQHRPENELGARRGRVHGPARKAIIRPGLYAEVIGDDSIETAVRGYEVLAELGVPAIVLWGGNYFANELPPSRCWLVWDKENTGSFADAELAWTNQDKTVRLLRHQWSGLIKASERGERRVHPTQKPVALADWVIETIAPEAKTVIDLFIGSGSTLIACERRSIACFAMEMAEAYVQVTIERWQTFAGKSATLDGDGRDFESVAAERVVSSEGHEPK